MRTRHLIAAGLAGLALTAAGCGSDTTTAEFTVDAPPASESASDGAEEAAASNKPDVKVPSGKPPKQLQIRDIKEGSGPAVKAGDSVSVNYVGVAYSTKEEFDNSYDRGAPFDLTVGQGDVIAGWDEGLIGMKAGGRRELIIPPNKAYGAQGSPPTIGPNETLVFVIDLVSID
ncbi:MAG: FKBP-type peptidyl-prolyl cis-trans isomerase [Solirubrobacterales bacterium]|nr:FKBP-type peptidyl-prolyl cis-trans isomerase [Solirubrobacterales bacterium]